MRVVADPASLLRAFSFPGGPEEEAFRQMIEGRLEAVTSPPLLEQLIQRLSVGLGWNRTHAEEATLQVARTGLVVRPEKQLSVIEADPDDDRVLEAAHEAGVEAIVAADPHLLALGSWERTRIIGASELVKELGSA
ncbi:MAG TPA: PIN domain-containing protein [Actinomycetota bacterium]|nr:PIN domain-containing protein [Actinomycetota bacterium]